MYFAVHPGGIPRSLRYSQHKLGLTSSFRHEHLDPVHCVPVTEGRSAQALCCVTLRLLAPIARDPYPGLSDKE